MMHIISKIVNTTPSSTLHKFKESANDFTYNQDVSDANLCICKNNLKYCTMTIIQHDVKYWAVKPHRNKPTGIIIQ